MDPGGLEDISYSALHCTAVCCRGLDRGEWQVGLRASLRQGRAYGRRVRDVHYPGDGARNIRLNDLERFIYALKPLF
jgi:hypothetical protein